MKVIKKLFVGGGLILSVGSFSFWRMPLEKGGISKVPTITIDVNDPSLPNDSCYSWHTQDNNTLNKLIVTSMFSANEDEEVTKNLLPFLKGEFEYNTDYWNILKKINDYEHSKIFRHGPKKVGRYSIKDGVLTPNILALTETEQNVYYIFKRNFYISPIDFKQSPNSLSGVKIDNTFINHPKTGEEEGKVMLRMNDKSIDLKTALLKHFEKPPLSDEFPYAISSKFIEGKYDRSTEYKASKIEPILNRMRRINEEPTLSCDLELLKESEILAVWCLIPQEVELKDYYTGLDKIKEDGTLETRTVERQMIGLAKDKNGKLYHWTTELGKDIKCLMLHAELDSIHKRPAKRLKTK